MPRREIRFRLNGVERHAEIEDQVVLLDLVRELGLIGAKRSCDMQVCGTCTLLLDGRPVSACTTLALEADGHRVDTVEGLSSGTSLHPLQQAFIENFAFQCGYCTPGMIVAAKALLDEHPAPSAEEVRHWMEGNICRCTGYQSIVDAILDASDRMRVNV
jgi:aerobic-type carbon monoxide dehydrogenase small subunit (CoxS/CutS family)